MCCCGKEHDNDPKYKTARCFACLNLAGEVIFLVTLFWAMFAAALAIAYMCTMHSGFEASDSSSTSTSTTDYWEYTKTSTTCTGNSGCTGSTSLCRRTCDYSSCPSESTAKGYAKAGNTYKSHDSSDRTLCSADYSCTLSESGYQSCGKCPSSVTKYCYTKTNRRRLSSVQQPESRRLSFLEKHAFTLYGAGVESIDDVAKDVRRLAASQEERDEDIKKIRQHAKEGCEASAGFYFACYGGFFFGLMSLIFSSINACSCCKDCCGGYQGQYKCFGIYNIVSAVWQLICLILLAVILSAVAGMNNIWLKYCNDAGISCETNGFYQLLKGIETALAISLAIAVFVFLTRTLSSIFALIAAGEEHSAQKEGATEVQLQNVGNVVVQGQPISSTVVVKQAL